MSDSLLEEDESDWATVFFLLFGLEDRADDVPFTIRLLAFAVGIETEENGICTADWFFINRWWKATDDVDRRISSIDRSWKEQLIDRMNQRHLWQIYLFDLRLRNDHPPSEYSNFEFVVNLQEAIKGTW